ncbi:hypothetical protein [Thiobacillus sedimenti]|uniref:DUF1574 domain-containing protein n=1 Tax=Thiobacillus sedimenti TaxID=3110231 RepID=A0ABZ1CMT0_9PROT|nr:hypothetical protein [Thiobacillus sp. SCUT-2]WRS39627.1 hypothetical protein VA613_01795 [Thiobacillus sp. SCUT-2]
MNWPRVRLPPGLGAAFWLAAALLGLAEAALHSEAVLLRYRSVFAVGRAYDKLHALEQRPPALLFIGNSRVDNGIDPLAVARAWPGAPLHGFNLGLPGANAVVYHGALRRLDARGLLGGGAIRAVVLGLDESALQDGDSLGYASFLADRRALWDAARYREWLGSLVRLWSYSGNLRQLREPEKALRFVEASVREVDPVGGAAAGRLGYRPGFGAAQNANQVASQEQAAWSPPSPAVEAFLWHAIGLLQMRGVQVFVTLPPLRDRRPAFVDARPDAAPYRDLLARLRQRGVVVLPQPVGYRAADFINAGHLNDHGAQRYSAELARQLAMAGFR